MQEWFKTASACFAGGAVAISLVAIPTFVWLPREFDETRGAAESSREESRLSRLASEEARDTSKLSLDRMDRLVISIARMDALPLEGLFENGISGGLVAGNYEVGKQEKFLEILPPDTVSLLKGSGKMGLFKYSDFDGVSWVFVDKSSFSKFTLEEQKSIEESFQRASVRFVVD